ncbi:hypothetical protein [Phytoactinopolyspora limicola]|uniref:hypothetical protein n=1 Tax=Phytoactinopolyspora limicola TaxID=2715536 RepID=UPI001407F52C|nr:hypothetical protein [Phytoactinopolyspora limicola]
MTAQVGFLGADVAQLRAFAAACDQAGLQVNGIRARISTHLDNLEWRGFDGDAFRRAWYGDYARLLMAVTETLDGVAYLVERHADEQENTSGDVPGAGQPHPPGGNGAVGGGAVGGGSTLDRIRELYGEWERLWGPVDLAIGLAPWVGAAVTWRDAVKLSYVDWVRHADQWRAANIGGWTGNLLTGLNVLNVGVGSYRMAEAAGEGAYGRAAWEGIGVGSTIASVSSVAALKAAGGVGLAAHGGWALGSFIYDTTGHTGPMIWLGDNVIGPAGDWVVGTWDGAVDRVTGWFTPPPPRHGGGGR